MNNYFKLLLSILALSVLFSCSNKTKQVEELQVTVIEVHDQIMPKLDDVMKLKREVKALKADTVQLLTPEQLVTANNIISSLDKADEGMMNWMRNYDSLMEGMSEDEKITYLNNQEVAIKKVKQDMLSSISAASKFIAEHQK